MAVVTQLYYQLYTTYQHQLHVSANAAVAIIRFDTIYERSYIDMIQHRTVICILVLVEVRGTKK